MNTVDHIYYINLDYRTDRELQIQSVIQDIAVEPSDVTRVQGIYTPGAGHIGCLLSHIKAIESFIASSYTSCMILEDDFLPLHPPTFWDTIRLLSSNQIDYDVVMLAYNKLDADTTNYDWLRKMNFSFTTSAYILHKKFAATLYEHLKTTYFNLVDYETTYKMKCDECCIDVAFTKLMPQHNWYCLYPRLGIQRESYSDIQGHTTNYNA